MLGSSLSFTPLNRCQQLPAPYKRSLLYGTRARLVLNLPAFENKTAEYTAYGRFHGNGPNREISTKKEPIRTLGFTSRPPCHIRLIVILQPFLTLFNATIFLMLN